MLQLEVELLSAIGWRSCAVLGLITHDISMQPQTLGYNSFSNNISAEPGRSKPPKEF